MTALKGEGYSDHVISVLRVGWPMNMLFFPAFKIKKEVCLRLDKNFAAGLGLTLASFPHFFLRIHHTFKSFIHVCFIMNYEVEVEDIMK